MDAHILWQMTTHLRCRSGHTIHANWTLPNARVQVENATEEVKMIVSADCCTINYEGAILIDGCLICSQCGAEVPSAAVEALTHAECPPENGRESPTD